MAASFRHLKSMSDAGWVPAVGDVLRAKGKVAGVLMQPLTSPESGCAAPPMVRVIVNSRSAILQMRSHKAGKCTRGNWLTLDRDDTPRGARAWSKLLRFWTWHVEDATAGRVPWVLEGLQSRDPNRCRTRADSNRHEPSPGASGSGRGRKCRGLPGMVSVLGFAPATGRGCATHPIPEGMAKLVAKNIATNGRRHAMNGGSQ